MSIKDLFTKITTFENATSGSSDVESFEFIKTKKEKLDTFQPSVDFATASNFAKYGSAYEYYTQTIERIYGDYPYDGSEREKILFELSSSYLDKWVFDNKYPKSTGYINFSHGGWGTAASITQGYGLPNSSTDYEYIYSRGGMHTASVGMEGKPLRETFDKSVIYDSAKNRTITYDINGSEGVTIEFWLKKAGFNHSKTGKEVILDLWNGKLSSSADYGRLTLNITGSPTAGAGANQVFRVTLQSGSTGVFEQVVSTTDVTVASLSSWSHYALSLVSASNGITSRFYKNGNLNSKKTLGTKGFGDFNGLVNGYIGALQTAPSGNVFHGTTLTAAGKLSASLDDFRFWKTRRTSEEIYNNWYRGIGGGTNSDDANVKLGVYYKFNEGVVGTSATDSVVLDYSGRIANGSWTGYSSGARSTNSAFTESELVSSEVADPIIYSTHPNVISLLTEMQNSGSDWDEENGSMLLNTLPQWIREEDEESNSNVKYLFQIMSNYFDTLHAQINELPKLKNKRYVETNKKALPFADRLLSEKGITVNNLFVDSTILEKYGDRDANKTLYEKNIQEVKNLIYTNIYNNLEFIYKSKGTERSVRNLLRCFGFDDELVKLNVYTDGGTHYFSDKTKQTTLNTKYINFNDQNYFASTVYQTSSANNSQSFISGSGIQKLEKYSAFTAEADIVIPYKIEAHEEGYFSTPFLSSSIYGFHQANSSSAADYTWFSTNIANLQVYLVRDKIDSKNAKFVLKNQDGTINLSTSLIPEIYDNQRWNLAVSVRPDKYGLVGNVVSSSNPTYALEFYGVTHAFDTIANEFTLTASLNYSSGSSYLSNAKRFFVGAHYTNFTGALIQNSDIQMGAFRLYEDYLDKTIIRQHNLDPSNYGLKESNRLATAFPFNLSTDIPSSDLIAINWNFDTVTGSDASGKYIVEDMSSGSTDTKYGWIDNIVRREHKGVGDKFGASKTSFVKNKNIYSQKKELPEISVTSPNIIIKGEEQKFFIRDEDVSDNFYTLEKSMYQVISEEMLNMFSSVAEFSNLMGKPVDKYRMEYKDLNNLRRLFFERVTGDLDFDRFSEYFKWIDTAISRIVEDLFPISSRFSGGISTVIDSHILERNKYQNKFPLLIEPDIPEAAIRGHAEMNYDWKHGHAPVVGDHNDNCLWQKDRKERTDIANRETLRKSINKHDDVPIPKLYKFGGPTYEGSTYIFRTLSKPYKLEKLLKHSIGGGINYPSNKDRDIIHNFVQRAGNVSGGVPQNTFLVGQGTGKGVIKQKRCDDVLDPNLKKRVHVEGFVGKFAEGIVHPSKSVDDVDSYFYTFGSEKMPVNVVTGAVKTGYNSIVVKHFNSGAVITNIHSDTTDFTNEVPMQGTFTQNWVGGHQHRHVDLNFYDASRRDDDTGLAPLNGLHNEYTREEAWQIMFSEWFSGDGAFGFVGADYGGPYPDPARKAATLYREERAKRPVNIKNIRTVTSSSPFFSHGNFTENHEIVESFGKLENNIFLRDNPDQSLYLPTQVGQALPLTTHPMSLIAQTTGAAGNIFGAHNNNRQPDITGVTGVKASGSFTVYGINHISKGAKLQITSSNQRGYVIETPTAGHSTVLTGSSDSDFMDNLQAHIQTSSSMTTATTYVSSTVKPATFLVAFPNSGVNHRVFMSGTYRSTWAHNNPFTWAGWLYISQSNMSTGVVYSQSSSAGLDHSRQIKYNSGTRNLKLYNNYVDSGAKKYIEWVGPVMTPYLDQWFHLVITHNSGASYAGTASNDVKMYLNGVNVSTTRAGNTTMGTGFTMNPMTTKYFLYNQSNLRTNTAEHKGGLCNVGVWNTVLSQAQVNDLYGGHVFVDYLTTQVAPTGNLQGYLPLTSSLTNPDYNVIGHQFVDGNKFLDVKYDTQSVTASINAEGNIRFLKSPAVTKSQIIVSLTASQFGTQFNGIITGSTPTFQTFFNFNNLAGGVNFVEANDIVNAIITGSATNTIITSRFSAPGGVEINSLGYLDVYAREYSAYNHINYRNYTVRSSGSGEVGTMCANSQINRREGLQTLLRRHTGKFGYDSQHGSITAASYVTIPNFHKEQRNGRKQPTGLSTVLAPVFSSSFDNGYITSLIPQSDYQYNWITSSLGNNYSVTSGKQRIYGYAPRDGILSSSVIINGDSGFEVPAIHFPSASEIFGV